MGRRILVIEDNPDNRILITDVLTSLDYEVIVAVDGEEGVARAKSEKPDLILMDLQMPGMDGLETTRRIRNDASTAQIPIVALTALTMPGDKERCMEAGVNAYLSKPISLQELHHTVTTYLTEVHSGHE